MIEKCHFPCGSVDWNIFGASGEPYRWVTSLAEVWIEMLIQLLFSRFFCVTSLAEVWIEIGMDNRTHEGVTVTSLAEVWIEMSLTVSGSQCRPVTSLAEVWIEIDCDQQIQERNTGHFPCGSVDWNKCSEMKPSLTYKSLPLRKCGLKSPSFVFLFFQFCHFPCGSVDWNYILGKINTTLVRHFPCGSVDWNFCENADFISLSVTSLAEVWIEI